MNFNWVKNVKAALFLSSSAFREAIGDPIFHRFDAHFLNLYRLFLEPCVELAGLSLAWCDNECATSILLIIRSRQRVLNRRSMISVSMKTDKERKEYRSTVVS